MLKSRYRRGAWLMWRFNLYVAAAILVGAESVGAAEAVVVELVQVPCQFLEVEKNHGFAARSADDCRVINAESGTQRLHDASVMTLKAGRHIFRVSNKNVPYELGFYLRAEKLTERWTLPKVSGGGIRTGQSKDYPIELVPGEYVFSCPLNPTLDYRLVVTK